MGAAGSDGLDNPAWAALTGAQAHLGELRDRAARFHPDVSPFTALADPDDRRSWADLATLVGPGAAAVVIGVPEIPAAWTRLGELAGVQMIAGTRKVEPDEQAVALTEADVPAMLELVELTKPGPFRPRTIEMGNYLGIKDNGRLVSMAGERMRGPGWTEISAVCTDPSARGRGLAARLVRAVGQGIRERGDVPMLHAAAGNTTAIRLYERLGFVVRRNVQFVSVRAPAPTPPC